MVATAKNRKNISSVNVCLQANSQNLRNSDGRRQLFGLSQAIREKAYQSTSPRSEENTPPVGTNHKQESTPAEKSNAIPTIEDRLRSLFNSDTEEVNSVKKFKNRSKTPDADVMIRNSSVHKAREKFSFHEGDSHRVNGKPLIDKLESSPQRRCASAVPSSFNERDRNRVPPASHHMSLDVENRIKHPTTTSHASNPTPYVLKENAARPNSAIPYQNGQRVIESGSYMNNRPVPTARRSLYTEKDLVQPNTRMAVNSQLSNSSQHYTAAQQARTHNVVLENPYARPNFITNVQAAPHQGDAQRNRPINQKLVYIPRNPTLNGNLRVNLRQVDHQNVPANMTTNNVNRSVHVNEAVVKTSYNPSINRVSTDLTATSYSRDYYPHQNFSFRRAVRRSLSSDSDKNKNDTKREQTVSSESQLGADKSSRKSDDRDSGTVVEPEASVFDFDSSVLSEEEKRDKIATPAPHKEDSRTSTPILPPLSSDDDFTDVVEPDEGHADISTRQSNASENRDQVRISQDFKQMHKTVPPRHAVNGLHVTASGGAELSTTESALHENPTRKFEQNSKLVPTKPYRVASSHRRGFYRRPSSGDEKRQKKSRNRRIYDDSDATDCSSRRPSYRIPDRKSYPYNPTYKNPHCSCLNAANEKSELGDTSSVVSMTTASVCSSLLRKSGSKRHHHHRKYHTGSDKYSREVKSITKRFSRLEAHVVTLARSLAQLSSELRQQNTTSREVELLRQQMQELRARVMLSGESPKTHKNNKLTASIKGAVHSKKNKHEKHFGEQTPLLTIFLKELGYEKYIKNFESESIGMMELPYLDEKRLQDLGIPLGPRIRIMKEAQKSSYV